MKKIFIVAGELSGDSLAAWFVRKQGYTAASHVLEGIGGDELAACGARLWERYESLNVAGLWPVACALPRIVRLFLRLARHLRERQVDQLVLVDFPGFNLRLARKVKRALPATKIVYVSPPQLWCWGAGRVETIRRYVDEVVVLYPFEVDWYAERGVKAAWLGLPLMEKIERYLPRAMACGQPTIGLFPASRRHELRTLLPFFLAVVQSLVERGSSARFVLFATASADQRFIQAAIGNAGSAVKSRLLVVVGEERKKEELGRCVAALAKPGTVSLELALLGIPSVLAFKTSWLTYTIARRLVAVNWMGLPNLLAGRMIMPEFIQEDATVGRVAAEVERIVDEYEHEREAYELRCAEFLALKRGLEWRPSATC